MSAIYCLRSNHPYISDFMYFPIYFLCLLLQQQLSDSRAVLLFIDVSPAYETLQVPNGCLIINLYEGLPEAVSWQPEQRSHGQRQKSLK